MRRGIAGWARQAGAGGWGWQAGAGRLGLAGWGWQMLAGWGWQVAAGSLGLGLVGWGWLAGEGAHLRLRRTVFFLQIPGIRRQLTSPNPLTPPRGSRWGGNSRGHPTPWGPFPPRGNDPPPLPTPRVSQRWGGQITSLFQAS